MAKLGHENTDSADGVRGDMGSSGSEGTEEAPLSEEPVDMRELRWM